MKKSFVLPTTLLHCHCIYDCIIRKDRCYFSEFCFSYVDLYHHNKWKTDYESHLLWTFPFNLFKSGKYFLFLLTKIYSSGFSIIPYIIRGKSNPKFIEIYTDLESNVDLVVLSNSITLTPGTITVDLDGHKLLILWLNAEDLSTTEAGYRIKGTLESKIKEGLWRSLSVYWVF